MSKRLGSPYRSRRFGDWLKIKNPAAPAVKREAEEDWTEAQWPPLKPRRYPLPFGERRSRAGRSLWVPPPHTSFAPANRLTFELLNSGLLPFRPLAVGRLVA